MAVLANRVKIRNNLIELSKIAVFSIRKFFVIILVLISCYLLYFSTPRIITNDLLESTGRSLSAGAFYYIKNLFKP